MVNRWRRRSASISPATSSTSRFWPVSCGASTMSPSTPPARPAGRSSQPASAATARPTRSGSSISPPRRACSVPSPAISPPTSWSRRKAGWCWKSPSAATSPPRGRSMTRWVRSSPRSRSSASTIISARRRCRTSSPCASPTCCSSPCGTRPISTMCRSRWPRVWGWRAGRIITTPPARCATWCRTIFSSCSVLSPWSRRARLMPMRCATRSSRCCARSSPSARPISPTRRCAASIARVL